MITFEGSVHTSTLSFIYNEAMTIMTLSDGSNLIIFLIPIGVSRRWTLKLMSMYNLFLTCCLHSFSMIFNTSVYTFIIFERRSGTYFAVILGEKVRICKDSEDGIFV